MCIRDRTISFRDLEIQKRENDLIGASFGRSFYVLDDYSLLRDATPELFDKTFHMFPIRRAFWYSQTSRIGGTRGYQGDSMYVAKNPDYGAVFNYYFKSKFESKKAKRKKKEAALKKAGKNIPILSIDELRAESEEQAPRNVLRISDSSGTVVAQVEPKWFQRNPSRRLGPSHGGADPFRRPDGCTRNLHRRTVSNR